MRYAVELLTKFYDLIEVDAADEAEAGRKARASVPSAGSYSEAEVVSVYEVAPLTSAPRSGVSGATPTPQERTGDD